jgi:hypothetical protein
MRLIGTIFSFIFAVIAIPLFALAACNTAVDASVLNRSTYDSILENETIFEDLLTAALPAIFDISGADTVDFHQTGDSPIQIAEIVRALQTKPEIFEHVASLLVPPEWLQTTVTQVVDATFAVAEGNIDAIEQEVSLVEVHERFTGEEGADAARLIITEAPTCTQTQLDQLSRFLANNESEFPICNPGDEGLESQMIELLVSWFTALGEQMNSDTVSISEMFGLSRDDARALNLVIELDRQGLLLTYLCPAAFIALIVIFTVRSKRGFGSWLGAVSLITGIVILMMIFGLQVAAFNLVAEILQANDDVGRFFSRLASELVRSAIGESSSSLLLQAGLFIALGFILLVIAWLAWRKGETGGDTVFITDDGQIISTATQKRIGSLAEPFDKA